MKAFALAAALAVASTAKAQVLPGARPVTRSHSDQFVVFGSESVTLRSRFPGIATNINFIALEPTLLAVSCERIKDALYRRLGAGSAWRGKIFVRLRPAEASDEPITICSEKNRDGWSYNMELPDVLERNRFIGAIVHVLLLEVANRQATGQSAEVPAWLAEGLSQELRASSEMEIMLPPPSWRLNGLTISPALLDARRPSPLARAQQILAARPPLTFQQLSWPADGQLSGEAGEVYRSSAQLFVNQLLELPGGAAALRAFLAELPRHLNWQLAFLKVFAGQFPRGLDVEKWWALQLVQFTGRDLSQLWTFEESWKKLDELLRAPVQVQARGDDSLLRSQVTLQIIIREWDRVPQMETLKRKLWELDLLRQHASPELAPLADDYRGTLRVYLEKRNAFGPILAPGKKAAPLMDREAEEAIRRLDALDLRLETFRPVPNPMAVSAGAAR